MLEPEEHRNPDRIARSMAAMNAGLDALERVKFAENPTIGEIAVAAPWAISIFACPILIGARPAPNCRPGMRNSRNIRP